MEEYDAVVARASAVGMSAYGLAKAAVLSFDVEPMAAKALLSEVKKLATADILEAVVQSVPIKAATTPDEIRIFQQILKMEEEILVILRTIEQKNVISLADVHSIRTTVATIKNTIILKLQR